jgi:tetratricopeptide (TPR) repeat protein
MVQAQWSLHTGITAAIALLLLLTAVPLFWGVSGTEHESAGLSTHNNSMENRGGRSQGQCIEPRGFECVCPGDKQRTIQFEDWRHSHILGTLQTDNPQDRQALARENAYHNCRENAIAQNCPDALEPCSTGPGGPQTCGGCEWCLNLDKPEVQALLTKAPGVSCEPPPSRAHQPGAGEGPIPQSQSPDAMRRETQAHLERALNMEAMHDADGAIRELRAAIRLDPNDADAHNDLGVMLSMFKDDVNGAIAEYRTAIRLNPNYVAAHVNLGKALLDKGDVDGAIAEYRAAIRLDPNTNSVDAHGSLGFALLLKGDRDGAITELRTAIRLDPNNVDAHDRLGVVLLGKGNVDGAITELRTAVRIDPNDAEAHAHLGTALSEEGDVDGAITELRAAIRLDPNFAEAHNNLGVALGKKGDQRGALEQYQTACSLKPKDSVYCQAARGKQ